MNRFEKAIMFALIVVLSVFSVIMVFAVVTQ